MWFSCNVSVCFRFWLVFWFFLADYENFYPKGQKEVPKGNDKKNESKGNEIIYWLYSLFYWELGNCDRKLFENCGHSWCVMSNVLLMEIFVTLLDLVYFYVIFVLTFFIVFFIAFIIQVPSFWWDTWESSSILLVPLWHSS